jgi:hypothetical protein
MTMKTNTKSPKRAEKIGKARVGVFKRCSLCGVEWQDRDAFLSDSTLVLNGYQGNLRQLLSGRQKQGLLLFTHTAEGCGTTLAFDPTEFKDEH